MYAIYGTGGFARELLPILCGEIAAISTGAHALVFVQDAPQTDSCNSYPVISFDQLCSGDHRERNVIVAIGDGRSRRAVFERCERAGLRLRSLYAASSLIQGKPAIGPGAVFCAFSMVTCDNVMIGKGFQCNIYSYVAHDCVIGDYVTFAPAVHCNGNVHIGDGAYIGTGAVIKQGTPEKPLKIGEHAIVGMGAVVTKNVPAGATVVGNPASPLQRNR